MINAKSVVSTWDKKMMFEALNWTILHVQNLIVTKSKFYSDAFQLLTTSLLLKIEILIIKVSMMIRDRDVSYRSQDHFLSDRLESYM